VKTGVHFFFPPPPRATGVGSIVPLPPVLAYGALANLFYSLGWVTEMMAKWIWEDQAPDLGPLLFRQGLPISVGSTLLPVGMAAIHWVVRVGAALLF
jgi:hypothetical protein